MSGDTRRETRRLANRWHGAKKSPKEKVSHLEVRTGVRLDWEFDDPIGVLKDCHRKIRRSLHVLWVIADRAAGRELTSDEIAAVRSAMNCLRVDGSNPSFRGFAPKPFPGTPRISSLWRLTGARQIDLARWLRLSTRREYQPESFVRKTNRDCGRAPKS
jgi:hypothetical protein